VAAKEFVTRGNLPHWYVPGAAHFVTYRLAGTLPAHVIEELFSKKRALLQRPLSGNQTPASWRTRVHKLVFAHYDNYLDNQRTIDWLSRPAIAAIIRGNLYHHHGTKYRLLAYCVMPNHVHVLLMPMNAVADDAGSVVYEQNVHDAASVVTAASVVEDCGELPDSRSPLSAIMHSLKSYTANQANKLLGQSGPFWQKESYDHWVRDDDELERIVDYINNNPVKAGLVAAAHEWHCGSARDRFLLDGDRCGIVIDARAGNY